MVRVNHMTGETEWRFPIEAGVLVYGTIVTQIRSILHAHDVRYRVDESKGWFESTALFTVNGHVDEVVKAAKKIKAYIDFAQVTLE